MDASNRRAARNQINEGGARGSATAARSRVVRCATGDVAGGHTDSAIAGSAGLSEGGATRTSTWQSAQSAGWTG